MELFKALNILLPEGREWPNALWKSRNQTLEQINRGVVSFRDVLINCTSNVELIEAFETASDDDICHAQSIWETLCEITPVDFLRE